MLYFFLIEGLWDHEEKLYLKSYSLYFDISTNPSGGVCEYEVFDCW